MQSSDVIIMLRQKTEIHQEEASFQVELKRYNVNTNRKLMRFQMIRLKIQSIAHDLGYSIGQFFIMAIYNTIVDW
jgi:hypothetical protein